MPGHDDPATGVAAGRRASRGADPRWVVPGVAVAGALITVAAGAAAWTLDRRNEASLLRVQTRQAAAVLTAQVAAIREPLAASLQIELATGGDTGQFVRALEAVTGPRQLFVSAGLLDTTAGPPRAAAWVGAAPELDPGSDAGRAFVAKALHSKTFVVTSPGQGRVDRVAYAIADPKDPRFVVYAERAIPANRLVAVESNPAFTDLDFATYLGPVISMPALATTDLPLSRLPLSGDTARADIAFGDTSITLVAQARRPLGGTLGSRLPWIAIAVGGALTIASTFTARRLVQGRRTAERDAVTISELYDRLDDAFVGQRTIAETLQRALLPRTNPTIAGMRIASRYVAGAAGVDIGGDWYSVIVVDDRRVGFVVGDVSGRGVSAAAVMARLRFTIRAYLLEGHPPHTVLQMCAPQIDILQDGHLATVLVGVIDLSTRVVTVANAGHPEPLIITDGRGTYLPTALGPPLGTGADHTYTQVQVEVPARSLLLAFTDGLIERRGEHLEAGQQRLADVASTAAAADNIEDGLTQILAQLTNDYCEDDIAVLALSW